MGSRKFSSYADGKRKSIDRKPRGAFWTKKEKKKDEAIRGFEWRGKALEADADGTQKMCKSNEGGKKKKEEHLFLYLGKKKKKKSHRKTLFKTLTIKARQKGENLS